MFGITSPHVFMCIHIFKGTCVTPLFLITEFNNMLLENIVSRLRHIGFVYFFGERE